MNKIILLGRLTHNSEISITPSEKTVCTFTLAVDRPYVSQSGTREVDFINIVVWGKVAEVCGNNVSKGQRLLIEGRLQIRNYIAKDGNKRYVTEVIANSIEFIERKNTAGTIGGHEQPAAKSIMDSFGKTVAYEEEIPF